jgi:hypothetical protein
MIKIVPTTTDIVTHFYEYGEDVQKVALESLDETLKMIEHAFHGHYPSDPLCPVCRGDVHLIAGA